MSKNGAYDGAYDMYERHFSLNENPFNMTPDPKYFYLSDQHEDALQQLLYGINSKKGFLLVTGEVGTGKTTICRTLLERLDADTETSLLLNPYLNDAELLKSIVDDFGIACDSRSIKDMVDALNGFLLSKKSEGKNAVLIIDEAQNLPVKSMELVRMLSNLETNTDKLLQIVLLGQPELKEKLGSDRLRQLNQRITIRVSLTPLSVGDTKGYIFHRLSKAGSARSGIFTGSSVKEVFRYTKGYPRLINSLCDRALLCAYSIEKRSVDKSVVKRAAMDVLADTSRDRKIGFYQYALAFTLMLLAVVTAQRFISFGETKAAASRSMSVSAGVQNAAGVMTPVTALKRGIFVSTSGRYLTDDLKYSLEVSVMNLLSIWDEGAAEINIIKNFTKPNITFDELRRGLKANGVELASKYTVLHKKYSVKSLRKISLPAVVAIRDAKNINLYKYSLITAYQKDRLSVVDPVKGLTEIASADFNKRYLNDAVIIYKSPFTGGKSLKTGTRSSDVVILEEQLKELGLFLDAPDDKFDEMTYNAVITFQGKSGLKADGSVGRNTKFALIREIYKNRLRRY